MKTTRAVTTAVLSLLILLPGGGCRTKQTVFLDSEADFGLIQRVAVLPFENLTTDVNASEKVRRVFLIELLSKDVVDVVDPAEVSHTLTEQRVTSLAELTGEELAKVAEVMSADAVIMGAVQEFGVDRSGSVSSAQVSLTVRMLDAQSGAVLWSAATSRGGAGAMARLFGVSGDSTTEATRKMVRDVLKTLVK